MSNNDNNNNSNDDADDISNFLFEIQALENKTPIQNNPITQVEQIIQDINKNKTEILNHGSFKNVVTFHIFASGERMKQILPLYVLDKWFSTRSPEYQQVFYQSGVKNGKVILIFDFKQDVSYQEMLLFIKQFNVHPILVQYADKLLPAISRGPIIEEPL